MAPKFAFALIGFLFFPWLPLFFCVFPLLFYGFHYFLKIPLLFYFQAELSFSFSLFHFEPSSLYHGLMSFSSPPSHHVSSVLPPSFTPVPQLLIQGKTARALYLPSISFNFSIFELIDMIWPFYFTYQINWTFSFEIWTSWISISASFCLTLFFSGSSLLVASITTPKTIKRDPMYHRAVICSWNPMYPKTIWGDSSTN